MGVRARFLDHSRRLDLGVWMVDASGGCPAFDRSMSDAVCSPAEWLTPWLVGCCSLGVIHNVLTTGESWPAYAYIGHFSDVNPVLKGEASCTTGGYC
jgi:hypothetical protein